MSDILFRSSVMAAKIEDTEGVLKWPTGGADAVALQDDLDITPAFESLENAEIRASIGRAKAIQGVENPTTSFSHYLKHSGTEGTEPSMGKFFQGLFGAKTVNATEYNTAVGSTVSQLMVADGTNFERGQGLLIKDGVNGYRIRAVEQVSGNALIMSFHVPNAPASGVGLGKAILYKPTNEDHPSLSVFAHIGNGGAIQAMSGAMVVSADISIAAGELINTAFSLEGLESYFNPVEILAGNRWMEWTDDDGAKAIALELKTYKDPYELAAALQSAMNAVTDETITVSYSDSTGKFSFAATGSVFTLRWDSGSNSANSIGETLGFDVADDDTGATSYEADNEQAYDFAYSATFDDSDPNVAKDNEIMVGDSEHLACVGASSVDFTITNTRAVKDSVCARSGRVGGMFTEREVEVSITQRLQKHEVDKWRRFRSNADIRFQYSFGQKEGGNWVAGRCGLLYIPKGTITEFNISEADGLAVLEMTISGYVGADSGGEVYLNFL